jgi:hypothetical protein
VIFDQFPSSRACRPAVAHRGVSRLVVRRVRIRDRTIAAPSGTRSSGRPCLSAVSFSRSRYHELARDHTGPAYFGADGS